MSHMSEKYLQQHQQTQPRHSQDTHCQCRNRIYAYVNVEIRTCQIYNKQNSHGNHTVDNHPQQYFERRKKYPCADAYDKYSQQVAHNCSQRYVSHSQASFGIINMANHAAVDQ